MQIFRFNYLLVIALLVSASSRLHASMPESIILDGYASFFGGTFKGASLLGNGRLVPGPRLAQLASIDSTVTAMLRISDQEYWVATMNPGRLWRVIPGGAPELALATQKVFITGIAADKKGHVLAISGPDGGLNIVNRKSMALVASIPVPDVKLLTAIQTLGDVVYMVGGLDTAKLLNYEKNKLHVLSTVNESLLRSLLVVASQGGDTIYMGSSEQGKVYRWRDKKLSTIVKTELAEVSDMQMDARGRLFVSVVDANGQLSPAPSAKAVANEGASGRRTPRSSELLRLDPDGRVEVLWRSKEDAIYAVSLLKEESQVAFGTGPNGRLFSVATSGDSPADLLLANPDFGDVVSLDSGGGHLNFSTSNAGGLFQADLLLRTEHPSYLSDVIDASAVAQFGRAIINGHDHKGRERAELRTGNTAVPDDTWTAFGQPANARYAQLKISCHEPVNLVRLTFQVLNRPPRIGSIQVLDVGSNLVVAPQEPVVFRNVTLEQDVFSALSRGVSARSLLGEDVRQVKWINEPGFRSVYAWAVDPDGDPLRYRFVLKRLSKGGQDELLKDWTREPFVSFDTRRLPDGNYRVQVDVDDLIANGYASYRTDTMLSSAFSVTNAAPVFSHASGEKTPQGARLRFDVHAHSPLVLVRCAAPGGAWVSVQPKEGLLDGKQAVFDVAMTGESPFGSVSCEATDDANQSGRVDIALH